MKKRIDWTSEKHMQGGLMGILLDTRGVAQPSDGLRMFAAWMDHFSTQ